MIETLLLQNLSPCPVMAQFLSNILVTEIGLHFKSDLGCPYLSMYRAALRGLLKTLSAYRLTALTSSRVISLSQLLSCSFFRARSLATFLSFLLCPHLHVMLQ